MAVRGRKPAPKELKVLRGDRADRIPADAPDAILERPAMPHYLEGDAAEEWERVCGELEALGVLSKTDRAAIAVYCVAYGTWRKACREVEAGGVTTTTDKGSEKTSPAVSVMNAAATQMARLLVEFGLTPSARSRVNAGGKSEPVDELGAFLRKGARA
jgi:P27 family predicted phage terminase small subunit